MAAKEAQLNVKLGPEVDRWLSQRSGGRERRAEYVRGLIEADMRRAREEKEIAMFNEAAAELTDEDLGERRSVADAFSGKVD